MILLLIILITLVSFLIGVGVGGRFVNKRIEKHIFTLEYGSDISDGQFRDIVVNTYADKIND